MLRGPGEERILVPDRPPPRVRRAVGLAAVVFLAWTRALQRAPSVHTHPVLWGRIPPNSLATACAGGCNFFFHF